MQKPTSWDEFTRLLSDPMLKTILRIRLLELAFTADNATAVKAIEMSIGGSDAADQPLGDVSTADLLRLREIVEQRLRRSLAIESRAADGADGIGAASDA